VLLVGPNGAGKSTLLDLLAVFQQIGRGASACDAFFTRADFAFHNLSEIVHLEVESELKGFSYKYVLVFELPANFKKVRVREEYLEVDGKIVFTRTSAQVSLYKSKKAAAVQFPLDWHLVALPLIQENESSGEIGTFKNWLSTWILVSPVPTLMTSSAIAAGQELDKTASTFSSWLLGVLQRFPAAYTDIHQVLKSRLPDINDFRFEDAGRDTKLLNVRFREGVNTFALEFNALSAGEKMFFLEAAIVALSKQSDYPTFCFWDEPDHFIAPNEIAGFVSEIRKSAGQSIITSHNRETIDVFPNEDVFILRRSNHLLPTRIERLEDDNQNIYFYSALVRGEFAEA
jgi:hypothetical protein